MASGLHLASGPSRASGSCFRAPDPRVFPQIKLAVNKTRENSGIRATTVEQYQTLCALSFFAKLENAARARGLGTKRYILTVSGQKANPARLIIKRRGNL